jgi:hypothetical protein
VQIESPRQGKYRCRLEILTAWQARASRRFNRGGQSASSINLGDEAVQAVLQGRFSVMLLASEAERWLWFRLGRRLRPFVILGWPVGPRDSEDLVCLYSEYFGVLVLEDKLIAVSVLVSTPLEEPGCSRPSPSCALGDLREPRTACG